MATESKRARTARMHREYAALCELIPVVECQLDFDSPFQLLVATVLSAQTTDKRVNQVTPSSSPHMVHRRSSPPQTSRMWSASSARWASTA